MTELRGALDNASARRAARERGRRSGIRRGADRRLRRRRPGPARIAARGRGLGRRGRRTAGGAHAEGQRPDVRSRELASLCQEAETAAGAGDLEAVLSQLDGIDGSGAACARSSSPSAIGRPMTDETRRLAAARRGAPAAGRARVPRREQPGGGDRHGLRRAGDRLEPGRGRALRLLARRRRSAARSTTSCSATRAATRGARSHARRSTTGRAQRIDAAAGGRTERRSTSS